MAFLFLIQSLGGCEEDPPTDQTAVDAAAVDGVVDPDQAPPEDSAARDVAEPDMAEPDVAEPDAAELDAAEQDAAAPDMAPGPDAEACAPEVEACNGSDDDCDTAIDEDVGPAACYTGPAATRDVGACRSGTARCMGGGLGACRGEVLPAAEDTCGDGVDNDCNGETDETCVCRDGQRQDCGSDVGACQPGSQVCQGNAFGPCMGAVEPAEEACNGLDDDCDGRDDEELPPTPCYDGPAGTQDVGRCRGGASSCVAGVPGACIGQVVPVEEACGDAGDDDCDGRVDEGCECQPGETRPCGSATGACALGEQACAGGVFGACEGEVGPAPEVCDGEDNDCDGETDGFSMGCYEGGPGTAGVGPCREGSRRCVGGMFGACEGQVLPENVDDCNGRDDDCDGTVDEDHAVSPTACGQGACAAAGERICRDGRVIDTCMPSLPAADLCNGEDDDCDGATDEGHVAMATQCGMGACAGQGELRCEGGIVRDSCMPRLPGAEVQDGDDDDCDNRVDEGFAYTTAELQDRFNRICGGCHGGAGGLILQGNFEADTVNVRANGAAGLDLIEPGNAEQSYLYHKLRGTQRDLGGGGSRMPIGAAFWADWELERLRLWIQAR